jgi:hypothetical protein
MIRNTHSLAPKAAVPNAAESHRAAILTIFRDYGQSESTPSAEG